MQKSPIWGAWLASSYPWAFRISLSLIKFTLKKKKIFSTKVSSEIPYPVTLQSFPLVVSPLFSIQSCPSLFPLDPPQLCTQSWLTGCYRATGFWWAGYRRRPGFDAPAHAPEPVMHLHLWCTCTCTCTCGAHASVYFYLIIGLFIKCGVCGPAQQSSSAQRDLQ